MSKSSGTKFASLDHATEAVRIETAAPLSLRAKIQQARQAKTWSQAQLAKAVNLKAADIAAFEAGKANPDPAVLAKLGRALGAKLSAKAASKTKAKAGRAA